MPLHTKLNKKPSPQDHYLSCPSTPYKTRNLPLKVIICHAPPHHIRQKTYPSRSLFVMPLHTILNKKPTPQDHYLSCPSTPYNTINLPLITIICHAPPHHIKQETYPSRSLFVMPLHTILNKKPTPQDHYLSCPSTPYKTRNLPLKIIICHAPPHHIKQETYPSRPLFVMPLHTI